jgi:hypothetical protein
MKMKDYWFLAFVRCSNECVFENQLGEQNDSADSNPHPLCTRPCFLFFVISPQNALLFSRMAFL